ncbi:MAG: bifunctional indole-3-glycerol-phosphate synthase TrpC/phosphoribosylanthranilate isomerase TrpF [Dorea sp.]|nr:bifunctional indole-3-glycerol-phosphate synthase TrpC/phosphoribosylanthranilate isomerase TrpF [Dorea sp.]
MTILDKLAAHAKERVAEAKKKISLEEIREKAYALPKGDFAFEQALKKPGISFICECKTASPSKGLIAPDFPYLQIAQEYQAAGADCISVLTEPKWFLGSDAYIREIAAHVTIPCIRKDFTVDEYMIYEAKLLGAGAVLLICSILTEEQVSDYIRICDELGLSALVETHDQEEVSMALRCGARMIGVNNRNLKDFTVDTENSKKLRKMIPQDVIFVSESGVKSAEDIRILREIGADAVLIGETLMRAPDKKAKLNELKGVQVKFCGLKRPVDIEAANALKPDYIGFVFYKPSKRYVTPEQAKELKALLDPKITAVGVFIDEPMEFVADLLQQGIIDMAQLHGNEDEDYIKKLGQLAGKKIIKAFLVKGEAEITNAEQSSADMVLLDAGIGGGKTFDWSLKKKKKKPYILAGGLGLSNINLVMKEIGPYGVDVSSGIETDGVKDIEKMTAFMKVVRGGK